MGRLAEYEPKVLFSYFDKICSIPHGSGNTDAICDYLQEFAKERGYACYRDKANNVLITKPASAGFEDRDTIILQGHTDMVCEKTADADFDFLKDGIEVIIEGDTIRANGTTLGGDNGIAVAMMLAVLDDKETSYPQIEALFTSDEEIGMIGAFAFDPSVLTGHKLINLDSEAEGVLMCSCAGGVNVYSNLPVEKEKVHLKQAVIEISGLVSGHSGVEIDKGRANANVLMARLLHSLKGKVDFRIAELAGGSRETAIADTAKALIGTAPEDIACVTEAVEEYAQIVSKEFATAEPNLNVRITAGETADFEALTAESTALACRVLTALPDGVQAMSADMPGLVQTSTNFGILKLKEEGLFFANTIRSSMTTQKRALQDKIKAIVELAGGTVEMSGDYPGWAYNPDSQLKDKILDVYKEMTGKEATVEAVHAGIECGLFADSIENLDCVSIGPDMGDVHTPREHLSISSSARTYELLTKVLNSYCK